MKQTLKKIIKLALKQNKKSKKADNEVNMTKKLHDIRTQLNDISNNIDKVNSKLIKTLHIDQ